MTSPVWTGGDDALGDDDAVGLLQRLRSGEVHPAELLAAARQRCGIADARLNAVAESAPDPPLPPDWRDRPLGGLPMVIKDNELLTGTSVRMGSRAMPDRVSGSDSPWVAQIRDLGTLPFAKTTLPEFGLTSTTESLLTGATGNPWDPTRSAGGSSGGSAALVGAGVLPMAHANDGGGSIRIPASCCGLVGLKASRGRIVDLPEVDRLPVPMIAQGVVTRTVRDTALYLAAAERAYANPALPPVGHVTAPGRRRLRIAVHIDGHPRLASSPDVVAAVAHTASLCAALGHDVTEIAFPYGEQVGVDFLRYWAFLAFSLQRFGRRLYGPAFDPTRLEPFTVYLADMFRTGAERLAPALRRLRRFPRAYAEPFAHYDVLLSPTLAHEPPPLGHLGPQVEPRTHLIRLLRFVSVTPLQNIAGAPALSVPLGTSAAGLPLGMQLAGPVGSERTLLELGLELEAAQPFARPGDRLRQDVDMRPPGTAS